jgi:hypothetical protein
MVLNLDSLLDEVRQWLNDSDAILWPQEVLIDSLRQALAQIQWVCPLKCTIAGLDEATATILGDGMAVLLIRLTRMFAWQYRLLQRSEQYHPDTAQPNSVTQLLNSEKADLQQALENIRLSYLQSSATLPYVVWPEDGSEEETAEA